LKSINLIGWSYGIVLNILFVVVVVVVVVVADKDEVITGVGICGDESIDAGGFITSSVHIINVIIGV
jgi:hypothetical protein